MEAPAGVNHCVFPSVLENAMMDAACDVREDAARDGDEDREGEAQNDRSEDD